MAKTKKKTKKKAAKKTVKKSAKKKIAPKRKAKAARPKSAAKSRSAGNMAITLPPALEVRLRFLAGDMRKSVDELVILALTEFADNWEDHMRTVSALASEDDRVQLSVPQE